MRRHSTDTLSLVFGLLFVTLAVVWMLSGVITFDMRSLGTIFASVFIFAGVVGLVRALKRPLTSEPSEDDDDSSPA